MATKPPPLIFSPSRRIALRRRMLALQDGEAPARFILSDMVEDVIERLGFLRFQPMRALVIGDYTQTLCPELRKAGASVESAEPALGFDEDRPYPESGYDLIVSLSSLDTVNDLPGALIHMRNALAPGGLMLASFMGAGSLPALKSAMLAADAERPAPRIHPQVDVRAGGQLLQRTGYSDPVIDSRPLHVSYRSFDQLVADLRAQGLSNVLADHGPNLSRAALERARATFETAADQDGRIVEQFEILTLSGWRR